MTAFVDSLLRPPRAYTPIPFWFLNGELTHEEIRRQLIDFEAHGVYGVVLHPRIGLGDEIGYLSPSFFGFLRTAVQTASELDMKIVLYDEGMYPSGSACGQVVEGHPELASRGLALTPQPLPGDRVLCRTNEGFLVSRFSGGTIRGIHYGEDDGEENAPKSADILNPRAVQRFISLTHDMYYRMFAPYFGHTIIGMFTDEPNPLGRNTRGLFPWTDGFEEVFCAAGGELNRLSSLFAGEENESTRLYRRLLVEREGEVYYRQLSAWCAAHGIALMGHPEQSDDIEVEKYFQVPGQDLVYRWVAPETGDTRGRDSTMAKCSADMAFWMGRERNLNECFGACNREGKPWYFTGSDMKWFIDYLAVRGVNLFVPHAFYYSLEGKRSGERPPDVGPGSVWWPYYRKWADYMRRLSFLMASTETEARTAVLCRNRDLCPERTEKLYETRRGFRYIPESMWDMCREEDGELVLGDSRFQAVLVPASEQGRFPSVPHCCEAVGPDICCIPEQKSLRAAKLLKDGETFWFLVNAGETPVACDAVLPVTEKLYAMDLWNGSIWPVDACLQDGKQVFPLRMARRESLLLFTSKEPLKAKCAGAATIGPEAFRLVCDGPGAYQKTYRAEVPASGEDLLICIEAEEMVEAFVNGKFVDAAFWKPQRLRVPCGELHMDSNEITLRVTGSIANRYGTYVPYGMA